MLILLEARRSALGAPFRMLGVVTPASPPLPYEIAYNEVPLDAPAARRLLEFDLDEGIKLERDPLAYAVQATLGSFLTLRALMDAPDDANVIQLYDYYVTQRRFGRYKLLT